MKISTKNEKYQKIIKSNPVYYEFILKLLLQPSYRQTKKIFNTTPLYTYTFIRTIRKKIEHMVISTVSIWIFFNIHIEKLVYRESHVRTLS